MLKVLKSCSEECVSEVTEMPLNLEKCILVTPERGTPFVFPPASIVHRRRAGAQGDG